MFWIKNHELNEKNAWSLLELSSEINPLLPNFMAKNITLKSHFCRSITKWVYLLHLYWWFFWTLFSHGTVILSILIVFLTLQIITRSGLSDVGSMSGGSVHGLFWQPVRTWLMVSLLPHLSCDLEITFPHLTRLSLVVRIFITELVRNFATPLGRFG